MYYQVYLDVLFVTNFVMDFYLIFYVKRLMKISYSWKRTFLGAFLGALGSCSLLLCGRAPVWVKFGFSYVLLPALMTGSGFGKGSRKIKIKQFLLLEAAACFLGGLCFFAGYKWSLHYIKAMGFAMAVSFLLLEIFRKIKHSRENIYDVSLLAAGKAIQLKGLYDTGNLLVCPWNGKEVHIADESFFEEFLGENGVRQLPEYRIPFSSLGQEKGLIRTVQITAMTIRKEDGNIIVKRNPLIGLGSRELFEKKPYRLILHSRSF